MEAAEGVEEEMLPTKTKIGAKLQSMGGVSGVFQFFWVPSPLSLSYCVMFIFVTMFVLNFCTWGVVKPTVEIMMQ